MRTSGVKGLFRGVVLMFFGLFAVGLLYGFQVLYRNEYRRANNIDKKDNGISSTNMTAYGSGNVVIDVYYEALCPDSKSFILHELVPVATQLMDVITVNLKPYGKATTYNHGGEITFKCQHGHSECHGNMIHACGINQSSDSRGQIDFAACLFHYLRGPFSDVEEAGKRCAQDLNRSWDSIINCAKGPQGIAFHNQYGLETHALNPKVTFIPTIVINNSQQEMRSALKNLKQVVCKLYQGPTPPNCR